MWGKFQFVILDFNKTVERVYTRKRLEILTYDSESILSVHSHLLKNVQGHLLKCLEK